jgi:hypothetical protein
MVMLKLVIWKTMNPSKKKLRTLKSSVLPPRTCSAT